ncbi:hypothetical protein ACETKC_13165 [Brevundimonas intermedia]|uniref:hypothetical protein n=1 Tax=Brevundimonas intermedia TaxID=74315 RepID=UPI0022F26D44|nr:hypothetical protein [Brevundimonas intermedia]
MIRRISPTLFAIFLLASPVAAQEVAGAPHDPVAAKAEGDRILAEGRAADVFDNITEDGVTRLRHKASGMICIFDAAARGNVVRIYPQSRMTPNRGDDVSCGSTLMGATFTIYATRYQVMPSEAQDMASSVAGIRDNWSNVQPLTGAFGVASVEGRPTPLFAAFKGRHPYGWDASTFIILTHIDGWSFKTRASGPVADADTIALTAGLMSVSSIPPPKN